MTSHEVSKTGLQVATVNKSAFARDLGNRLGIRLSRQMLDKYARRGMPIDAVDSALQWLALNTVGAPGRRAATLAKRATDGTATLQPADDDCGANGSDLTAEDAASFYQPTLADSDVMALSQVLQERVPGLAQCSPAMAEAVRRAIRETICAWSGSMACPHCRREVGIVEPAEPLAA